MLTGCEGDIIFIVDIEGVATINGLTATNDNCESEFLPLVTT